ncbi:hypothetical protein [Telluribacter sp. SYSU D00476]|uniref:hypothetical protein n=1 Tax=Telluribacter sp. SYSU D00476 TaxID=2811430 RepID=UPI001FF2AE3F|nr:hypothetical protein [Telluribacter sp. SYSU D00476]
MINIHKNLNTDSGSEADLTVLNELESHIEERTATLSDPAIRDENSAESKISKNLQKILDSQLLLKVAKTRRIEFTKPIIRRGADPVIFPNTINVIQGKAGVHKSRLAEVLSSCFLLRDPLTGDETQLLGFAKNFTRDFRVLYVDTERNLKEQLPYALQSIQLKAGYSIEEQPEQFDFISLLDIERRQRFYALQEYLDFTREQHPDRHIFIVLDVITDCIRDFNRTEDSMQLLDLMNLYINQYDVTFLALIHENPGGEKARGHLGTEIMNKASTVIQVGFEKDASQNDTDLIRVKFLKCRSTKRLDPFHIKYSQEAKGLVLADASDMSELVNKRRHKAEVEDLVELLEAYLGDGQPLPKSELMKKLCEDFQSSARTISERLSTIIEEETTLHNEHGQACSLIKAKAGKEVVYRLQAINPYRPAGS